MKELNFKSVLFNLFKFEAAKIIKIDCESLVTRKEELEIIFSESCKGVIRIGTVTSGYRKGEFGAYSNFKLFGGPVIDLIKKANVKAEFDNAKLLFGDSSFVIKKLNHRKYEFVEANNIELLTTELIQDFQDYYIPIFEDFTSLFDRAIRNFEEKEYYRLIDRNRFIVGVALARLAHDESFVNELINMATISVKIKNYDRKDFFSDYNSVQDPLEEIVKPIINLGA